MSFIVFVIVIAVSGLVVGALARLALPGKDPMSLGQTMLLGIAGSLIGGLITYAIWDAGPGIVVSVLAATVIMYFIRRSRGGGLTDPGRAPLDR
ncbi:MAG: GlsB/YeaQ/YmgE family stress response membrane protein [Solirubrobacterales bacterium]